MATTDASDAVPLTSSAVLSRIRSPIVLGLGVCLTTLALHVRDPHIQGSWGACPTALILGLDCPACGSLRAVHDLTNFDVVSAASSNLLFVLLSPLVVLWWARWVLREWRGVGSHRISIPKAGWLVFGFVLITFTLVRNLPMGAWLHS